MVRFTCHLLIEIPTFAQSTVRKFVIPKINFKAETYPDLIDWEKVSFTEPPITLQFSNEKLQSLIDSPLSVLKFLCHTQQVERAIKLVTEAASSVIGPKSRDGYIRQPIRSRKDVSMQSKQQFFTKLENK